MNAGMNCTAWNSLVANALTSSPSAIPSTALSTAITTSAAREPATSRPSSADREAPRRPAPATAATHARTRARSRREVGPAIGSVIRRSSVPLVRSRSIVDRGHEEHHDEREHARAAAPRRAGRSRLVVRSSSFSRPISTHGTTMSSATVRGSCAQLAQHAGRAVASVARRAHRRRVRALDQPQERLVEVVRARSRARSAAGSSAASSRPSRISSSRSHRAASSITWLETSSVAPVVAQPAEERPQVAAQHRVEADGRLVQHEQLRRAEQRARERHAVRWPPESRPTRRSARPRGRPSRPPGRPRRAVAPRIRAK